MAHVSRFSPGTVTPSLPEAQAAPPLFLALRPGFILISAFHCAKQQFV
jgi:hypothetical protein